MKAITYLKSMGVMMNNKNNMYQNNINFEEIIKLSIIYFRRRIIHSFIIQRKANLNSKLDIKIKYNL